MTRAYFIIVCLCLFSVLVMSGCAACTDRLKLGRVSQNYIEHFFLPTNWPYTLSKCKDKQIIARSCYGES